MFPGSEMINPVALFGASGVFGQLQDALNTIWGLKPKPGKSLVSFLRARRFSKRRPLVVAGTGQNFSWPWST